MTCTTCKGTGRTRKPDENGAMWTRRCACRAPAWYTTLEAGGVPKPLLCHTLLTANQVKNWAEGKRPKDLERRPKPFDLKNLQDGNESLAAALDDARFLFKAYLAQQMDENLEVMGVTYQGNPGVGKTALGCAILGDLLRSGVKGLKFTKLPVLLESLNQIRRMERPESDLLDPLCKAPVLMVDDVGAYRGGLDYEARVLSLLLDEREAKNLPMIVTTNLTPEQMKKRFQSTKDPGDAQAGARMLDRLETWCPFTRIAGKSYRPNAASKRRARFAGTLI